jgi:hypothetical protein
MVQSLGILPERDYHLFCVVERFGVELRSIDGAAEIIRLLGAGHAVEDGSVAGEACEERAQAVGSGPPASSPAVCAGVSPAQWRRDAATDSRRDAGGPP